MAKRVLESRPDPESNGVATSEPPAVAPGDDPSQNGEVSQESEIVDPGANETPSHEAASLEKIKLANIGVEAARREWDAAKEEASDCKKLYDGAVLRLSELIKKETAPPEAMPLFDAKPVPADEAWRAIPLREALLGLPERIYDALSAKTLNTMGEFADWSSKEYSRLTDIPKIGEAMADRILDASDAFWVRWKAEQAELVKDENAAATGETQGEGEAE